MHDLNPKTRVLNQCHFPLIKPVPLCESARITQMILSPMQPKTLFDPLHNPARQIRFPAQLGMYDHNPTRLGKPKFW